MKCFRCQKDINKKDKYYSFTEYSKGVKLKTDYAHKECWDKFMKQFDSASTSLKQSNYLLNGLGKHMRKVGILPEQEVEYIC